MRKLIHSSIVYMQQASVDHGSDPQATIAIPQQPVWPELSFGRNWIRLALTVPELGDSGVLANQNSAVITLDQCINSLRRIWHRIQRGRSRLPSPKAIY